VELTEIIAQVHECRAFSKGAAMAKREDQGANRKKGV
jgi:hypothetical protein